MELFTVAGAMPCQDTLDCARMNLAGYICQNLRCVCDPNADTGLFPCRSKNIDLTPHTSCGIAVHLHVNYLVLEGFGDREANGMG
jgi:hypothetical protein